jgi:hypothetical protein
LLAERVVRAGPLAPPPEAALGFGDAKSPKSRSAKGDDAAALVGPPAVAL